MKVIAYDPFLSAERAQQLGVERIEDLDELLGRADIVTLHTNLSDETRHLINTDRLATMKKGAVLINTARSELVDLPAIIAALKSGQLAGYGTDVLDEEPPPKDHPLFACPTAVITPHIGSRTYESVARQAKMAAENLIAVLNGKKPLAQANTL